MKHVKKKSEVYAYLQKIGVLETNDEVIITHAKRLYWKEYKKRFAKNKRRQFKATTVFMNKQEYKTIREVAARHKRSVTAYIKESSLCYAQQRFLVPDILAVHEIKEALQLHYVSIQRSFEDGLLPYAISRLVLLRLEELERTVLNKLEEPKIITGDS
jgi:hypothetical protein